MEAKVDAKYEADLLQAAAEIETARELAERLAESEFEEWEQSAVDRVCVDLSRACTRSIEWLDKVPMVGIAGVAYAIGSAQSRAYDQNERELLPDALDHAATRIHRLRGLIP